MQDKVWKTVLIGKTGFWPPHPGGDPSQDPFSPMTTVGPSAKATIMASYSSSRAVDRQGWVLASAFC